MLHADLPGERPFPEGKPEPPPSQVCRAPHVPAATSGPLHRLGSACKVTAPLPPELQAFSGSPAHRRHLLLHLLPPALRGLIQQGAHHSPRGDLSVSFQMFKLA